MNIHLSYLGLVFLILLFVPNLLWTSKKPEGYDEYVAKENRLLRALERTGETLVTCFALVLPEAGLGAGMPWTLWLAGAGLLILLYEAYWVRYFRSKRTMEDFYRSFLGIPVAGAALPVLAFLLLGIYGKSPMLLFSVLLLGVGHIGIHLGHLRAFRRKHRQEDGQQDP